MPLTSILCRLGRKRGMRDLIKSRAPKDFKTYVEPFVGTGDIFLSLNLDPSVKAVINDLDPMVAQSHKIIKSNPSIANLEKYNMSDTQLQAFVRKTASTPLDKLAKNLAIMCGSYGGIVKENAKIYKFPPLAPKLNKIPDLAEYMKNTTITQQDYRAVFRKYDSASTFIYLDPPYEKSADLYKEGVIDYEDMAKIIKSAKGKVMLSINDSPEIRAIFKGLKISKVRVKGGAHGEQSSVGQDRNELLITNY